MSEVETRDAAARELIERVRQGSEAEARRLLDVASTDVLQRAGDFLRMTMVDFRNRFGLADEVIRLARDGGQP